jgi:hypothetical protein
MTRSTLHSLASRGTQGSAPHMSTTNQTLGPNSSAVSQAPMGACRAGRRPAPRPRRPAGPAGACTHAVSAACLIKHSGAFTGPGSLSPPAGGAARRGGRVGAYCMAAVLAGPAISRALAPPTHPRAGLTCSSTSSRLVGTTSMLSASSRLRVATSSAGAALRSATSSCSGTSASGCVGGGWGWGRAEVGEGSGGLQGLQGAWRQGRKARWPLGPTAHAPVARARTRAPVMSRWASVVAARSSSRVTCSRGGGGGAGASCGGCQGACQGSGGVAGRAEARPAGSRRCQAPP